jgi:anion-transporting  ArsA/GET3 family ATPase
VVEQAGLTGRFETLRLTTRSSLDEYLKIYLRLPLSPSRLGPLARIFDYVSAAAPGVRELLIIGKIGWEVREGRWDDIIVDAPATGHVVELLTAPEAITDLVPSGPLAAQAGWLADIVARPETGVTLVTIPEELPVTETEELAARLVAETSTVPVALVVNRAPVELTEAGLAEAERLLADGDPIGEVSSLAAARHRVASEQAQRIASLDLPTVTTLEDHGRPVGAVRDALKRLVEAGER